MTHASSDAPFVALIDKIARERGFLCGSYKEKCLRRRIAVRMRARSVHTYDEYGRVLDQDPGEWERLLDALTINVTKLFRNWETFTAIAEHVVPSLWALPDETIRIWSAGCASGEEPYSLAILFHRYATQRKELSRLGRVRITGSDIDRASLAAAEEATYADAAFADTPPALRDAYFPAAPFTVPPHVRALARFVRNDLLRDAPPVANAHLITCRNVIIYFDRASQEALFERFADTLSPGGFLVLGKVETLLGRARSRFAPVDSRERIFRRL
ncbi:MAG TPA: protein-glutamate O-methyltransferase CheR [Gemmatimonadaceae bacterium]|nr:protein-glutamate O-methyltransferase CheR [Gemmatimonadaceae bacterium]